MNGKKHDMRKSEYTDNDKLKIVSEIESTQDSIIKACNRNGISIATYYKWKKLLRANLSETSLISSEQSSDESILVEENSTLRKLYINLSAHNYELAQFLDKH